MSYIIACPTARGGVVIGADSRVLITAPAGDGEWFADDVPKITMGRSSFGLALVGETAQSHFDLAGFPGRWWARAGYELTEDALATFAAALAAEIRRVRPVLYPGDGACQGARQGLSVLVAHAVDAAHSRIGYARLLFPTLDRPAIRYRAFGPESAWGWFGSAGDPQRDARLCASIAFAEPECKIVRGVVIAEAIRFAALALLTATDDRSVGGALGVVLLRPPDPTLARAPVPGAAAARA